VSELTKGAVLKQAAQRVTLPELALWLGAPISVLHAWMLGLPAMPERELLLVLDLLDKLGVPLTGVSDKRAFRNVHELRRGRGPSSVS
jgi:hypothetical protein